MTFFIPFWLDEGGAIVGAFRRLYLSPVVPCHEQQQQQQQPTPEHGGTAPSRRQDVAHSTDSTATTAATNTSRGHF